MPIYPRLSESRIRLALRDTRVVAITGPRQSGKTTLARRFARQGRSYITLDDPPTLAAARSDPVAFVRDLDRAVIDEVQRAPDVLLAIKRSVDEDTRPGRFLLAGSADLSTIATVRESLAGRIETSPLLPLSRSELLRRKRTQFIDSAFRGEVPEPVEALSPDSLVRLVAAGGFLKRSQGEQSGGDRIGTGPTSIPSLKGMYPRSLLLQDPTRSPGFSSSPHTWRDASSIFPRSAVASLWTTRLLIAT